MDLDLGAVAFWLAVGAFLTAGALSGWLREKEIQKTIRAMIELSFDRMRRIMACTCSSSSRSLSLLRSRYTGRLLRLFRMRAIL